MGRLGSCRHSSAVLTGERYHENRSDKALDTLIDGLE